MKTEQAKLDSIILAIKAAGVRLFDNKSSDPTYNAQRNLDGITHYVDPDTLRWHKSRVLSARDDAGGLLFSIRESVSIDMHNTKRGQRFVVFDVFGSTVFHPSLEECCKTEKSAYAALDKFETEFDIVAHYRAALASKLHYAESDVAKLKSAIAMISDAPAVVAA